MNDQILTDTHGMMHRSASKAQLADSYCRRLALAVKIQSFILSLKKNIP